MKIAFVVDEDISKYSGVVQKLKAQSEIWEKEGNEVRIISLRSEKKESVLLNAISLTEKGNGVFNKVKNLLFVAKKLGTELENFKPDIVYMRYIIYRPFLIGVINCKYVVELNTVDVEEFKNTNRFAHFYNLLFRNYLIANANALIAVSSEILNHYSIAKYNKKNLVLGNGIKVSDFKNYVRKEEGGKKSFVFIGSPRQTWHGVDKILELSKLLPEYNFHIIGPDKLDLNIEIKSQNNLFIYGYLDKEKACQIVRCSHVGISSAAMHRNKMNEASTLKSRQYLSQGLPIVVPYKDTDLSNKRLPFVLEIGNFENNLTNGVSEIKKFIESSSKVYAEDIVKFATEHLDSSKKEKIRLNFLKSI